MTLICRWMPIWESSSFHVFVFRFMFTCIRLIPILLVGMAIAKEDEDSALIQQLSVLTDTAVYIPLFGNSVPWNLTSDDGIYSMQDIHMPTDVIQDLLNANYIDHPYYEINFLTQKHVWTGEGSIPSDYDRIIYRNGSATQPPAYIIPHMTPRVRTWTYSTHFTTTMSSERNMYTLDSQSKHTNPFLAMGRRRRRRRIRINNNNDEMSKLKNLCINRKETSMRLIGSTNPIDNNTISHLYTLNDKYQSRCVDLSSFILVVEGIKMGSHIIINGIRIGTTTNQFRRYFFPIDTEILQLGQVLSHNHTSSHDHTLVMRKHEVQVQFDPAIPTYGRYMAAYVFSYMCDFFDFQDLVICFCTNHLFSGILNCFILFLPYIFKKTDQEDGIGPYTRKHVINNNHTLRRFLLESSNLYILSLFKRFT